MDVRLPHVQTLVTAATEFKRVEVNNRHSRAKHSDRSAPLLCNKIAFTTPSRKCNNTLTHCHLSVRIPGFILTDGSA